MTKGNEQMATKPADRRAKIEAAAPKSRGGANRIVVATVVAVLAIAAVVAGVIIADQSKKSDLAAGGSSIPAGAAAMGAGLVVNPSAPADVPTLDLWADFQCPACKSFEDSFGGQLDEMAQNNEVKLVVHVLSFLDQNLGNDSSNRAANAAFCAADQKAFFPYYRGVYAIQPAQEGDGYTDEQLRQVAEASGITGAGLETWQKCYDAREHNQYVESVQTQSAKDGVNGTPTLKLDGEALELRGLTPQSFADRVKAASQ
ncbi:thioredoxin domain-containing protein [Knoellia sp. 3-2P3]|uniref:DsbA family protein n=1 Tax=unclassified Knoellia TaxID=2618719 RepID=UPI0023D985BD|nr:thioredoxin domain-containing protein [Knoellia sp. 3-2P3]MDF2091854.1 thioredoxin domain-containing protein [Knoellia sp. 3-2P3]